MVNLYQILDVAMGSSVQEIRTNFRRKARQYHPDKNPNNDYALEQFKKISQAYEILSDPDKRANYDSELTNFYSSQNQARKVNSNKDFWQNVGLNMVSVASNMAHGWANGIATEVMGEQAYRVNHQSSIELAESLDYSTQDHRDGGVTFRVRLSPSDQQSILSMATRKPLDDVTTDIGTEFAYLLTEFFRDKWT